MANTKNFLRALLFFRKCALCEVLRSHCRDVLSFHGHYFLGMQSFILCNNFYLNKILLNLVQKYCVVLFSKKS